MRLNNILFILIILASSCIESFVPETSEYENVLFIEALITNDPLIPPQVIISTTLPVTSQDSEPVPRSTVMISGAGIVVSCDDGTNHDFIESSNGRYVPADPTFIGETDKSYMITINYDNQTFESEYEILMASPEIDSLTSEIIQKKETEDGDVIYGRRFYASTHDNESDISYYRWLLDASYAYNVPFNSTHRWIDRRVEMFENNDLLDCFAFKEIYGIYVSSTEGLNENKIIEAPLNFESQYGDELSLQYSLHAKQLNISTSAYNFWADLSKLIYETGGLYETQPFRLNGNIECVSDSKLKVIGIFEVAGVSEAREFFYRPAGIDIIRMPCDLALVGTEDLPWGDLEDGAFLYEDSPGSFYTAHSGCFDCTVRGGTTEKPPFWEYKK